MRGDNEQPTSARVSEQKIPCHFDTTKKIFIVKCCVENGDLMYQLRQQLMAMILTHHGCNYTSFKVDVCGIVMAEFAMTETSKEK